MVPHPNGAVSGIILVLKVADIMNIGSSLAALCYPALRSGNGPEQETL